MSEKRANLVVVLGPTASGKTAFAVRLARRLGAEIISADSRQVYKGMDIGTGKDLDEYRQGGPAVTCHLIDIVEPTTDFSVFDYQRLAYDAIGDILTRGRPPILCGGTGLYLDAVLRGYIMTPVPENPGLRAELEAMTTAELAKRLLLINPDYHTRGDLKKRKRLIRALEIAEHTRMNPGRPAGRPEIRPLVLGIRWPRAVLRERIGIRLEERLNQGLIEEVERLRERGLSWERLDSFGLEYRYVAKFLQNLVNKDELIEGLYTAICQFAKRQETWFRGMEKKGIIIHWLEEGGMDALDALMVEYGLLPAT